MQVEQAARDLRERDDPPAFGFEASKFGADRLQRAGALVRDRQAG